MEITLIYTQANYWHKYLTAQSSLAGPTISQDCFDDVKHPVCKAPIECAAKVFAKQ